MLASQARRFGETLVERHVLSRDDLEHALDEAQQQQTPLPAVLLQRGLVGSKDLTAALAQHMGIRFVDFLDTPIHQDAPTLVPADARPPTPRASPSTSRSASSSWPSPSRPTTRRSRRSATRPATRSSRRSPTACELRARDRDDLRRSTHRRRARSPADHRASRSAPNRRASTSADELHINDLLELRARVRRLRPPPHRRLTAGRPRARRPAPDDAPADAERLADPPDGVLDHLAEAAGEVRERARARHVVRAARQGPLPRERLPAARLGRLCDARDPVRDRRLRHARRAAGRQVVGVPAARPGARHRSDRFRASRRRSRRSSTS